MTSKASVQSKAVEEYIVCIYVPQFEAHSVKIEAAGEAHLTSTYAEMMRRGRLDASDEVSEV